VPPKSSSSFWGVTNYAETPLERESWPDVPDTSWADALAWNDANNQFFMHGAILAAPETSLLFAKAGWNSRYGLPDLSDGTGNADAADASMPLSDAPPFEYKPDIASGDATSIAVRGVGEAQEAECHARYDIDMELCNFKKGFYGGDARTYLQCKTEAFQNYQSCRGY
jgi:hypothetical protein